MTTHLCDLPTDSQAFVMEYFDLGPTKEVVLVVGVGSLILARPTVYDHFQGESLTRRIAPSPPDPPPSPPPVATDDGGGGEAAADDDDDDDAAASDTTEDEAGQDLMPTGTLAVGAIIGIVVAVLIICLCIVICVFFGCFGICGVREERLVVKEGQPPPPSEPRRWTQVPVKFLAEQAGKTSPVNLSTRSFNTGTRQGTTPPYAKEKTHEDFVKEVAAGPTVHRL